MPTVKQGVSGRQELRHPGQDQIPDAERITGNEIGLTDALQILHEIEVFRQRFAHLRRREEGGNLRLELLLVEQQRHAADDMVHQLRHQRLYLLHADLPEKTALLQPCLYQLGPCHHGIPIPSPDCAIDDQPLLNGEMTDDPVGVRQDGIVTGQGR